MQFALTDEQQLIRDSARAFFDECAGSAELRAAIASADGYDHELWRRMTDELGWSGIAIAERYGGAGLGAVELAILQHEQGRRLVPTPFFATVCLAAPLIRLVADEQQQSAWLSRIAAGAIRFAVGITGDSGRPGPDGLTATLQHTASGYRLDGMCGFVVNGHACDTLLVAARAAERDDGNASAGDALSIVLVDPSAAGVGIEPLTMLDLSRPMAHVRFSNVKIGPDDVLGEPGAARTGFERALDHARIALAAEAVGTAEMALEMTTAFVKERVQFGRPVGSFQAVKHRLADMLVALEAARSAAWYAACVADELPDELAEAASIAKAACSDAAYNCASNAIQLHGGVGFTWDHDAHLYFKRARACSTLLGSPAWHRERLARLIGLGAAVVSPSH